MENASKALLIAGGVLIAILIISLLILMLNQIGDYQKSKTSSIKDSQLAAFNSEFEKYTDDNMIDGTDIISLANKVIDYNKKDGIANSVDYDIKMELKVDKIDLFRQKYSYNNANEALFGKNSYTITNNNSLENELSKAISSFNGIDISMLKKVSSIYSKYSNDKDRENEIKKALLAIDSTKYRNWTLDGGIKPTKLQIKNYKEYSEFKTSKFKISRSPEYRNGQICRMFFEFVK